MSEANIEDFIGFLMIQVMRGHRRCAENNLGELGVHVGQEIVLFHLWHEDGITQTEIAECMCVEPPTVTKMVQRMEAAGIIERRSDPEDGRVSRVYLTPHGRALQQPVLEVWKGLEARTVKGLSDAEQMLLRRLLMQIGENFKGM